MPVEDQIALPKDTRGKKWRAMRMAAVMIGLLCLLLLSVANIEIVPSPWWDEGWTLCVARNWVVLGHYGCLLSGQPAPPILAGHFPVVAPVALSFSLLGVGVWQARIVGLLFTVGALSLLYYLTRRLFSPGIAIVTLVILFIFPVQWKLHPLIMGRQVLGEMPMLFYLLGGYACFLNVSRNARLFLPLASICWGIALMSKAQVWPFWTVSLLAPMLLLLFKRERRFTWFLVIGLMGTLCTYCLLGWMKTLVLSGHTIPHPQMAGLRESIAIVLTRSVRQEVLLFVFQYCFPTLCGLVWATLEWLRKPARCQLDTMTDIVRLMLLVFSASWFVWFTFLSTGWRRYAFPSVFLASPYTTALLHRLWVGARGFREEHASFPEITRRVRLVQGFNAGAAIVLVAIMSVVTTQALYQFWKTPVDRSRSAHKVARFINSLEPNARVETFESELLFMLERPYHYPPAKLNLDHIRSNLHNEHLPFDYDPLTADPDYLIIGDWGRWYGLYNHLVQNGTFSLVWSIGHYQIYRRVR